MFTLSAGNMLCCYILKARAFNFANELFVHILCFRLLIHMKYATCVLQELNHFLSELHFFNIYIT